MRLNTLRIPCIDLSMSIDFYENKLGLAKIFGSIEQGYVGFDLENSNLIIEHQEKGEFEAGRYLGFSLEVDDLDDFYRLMLERSVEFSGPPEDQDWGGKMTHIIDPSQNSFSVIQADGHT